MKLNLSNLIKAIFVLSTLAALIAKGVQAIGDSTTDESYKSFSINTLATLGTTQRVSVSSSGIEGNDTSGATDISSNGRYILIYSDATNLVDGDSNGEMDAFVYDQETGTTELVSIASDGAQANLGAGGDSISSDGRYVTFNSASDNLVIGDTNNAFDIFVHDRHTKQTRRVSISSDGGQANDRTYPSWISGDGNFVAYSSWASNLVSGDTNGARDIFVHDLTTGQTERVSVASDGTEGNYDSYSASISGDGQFIAFYSFANNLVPGDTNGYDDVFIYDRNTKETNRVSIATDGSQGNASSYLGSISMDGRFVVFGSNANNLVDGDTNNELDVFVHDRQTGETKRVSVASDGTQGNGPSWPNASISQDGHYVVYRSSATNLVGGDTNGHDDIFIHDRLTGETSLISINSYGDQGNASSWEPLISADGRFGIFTSSADNFVCNDSNAKRDAFVHDRFGSLSSISGRVTLLDDTPIPSVTIFNNEGNGTSTDINGIYLLDGLAPCTYTITPEKDNYIFTPTSMQITVPPNFEYRDFIGIRRVYSFLPAINHNYCSKKYYDDFSDPQSGWPIFQDEDSLYEYINGEYRIMVKNVDWWATASPDYQAADFSAGVDVRNPSGLYGTYGIVFGLAEDWSHFYTFEIDPEGYYGIWRFSDTEGWTLLTVNHSSFLYLSTATNSLKVKRDGSTIEVYANDHLLTAIRDGSFVGMGYLGLIVSSVDQPYLDVRFDNFFVTPSECDTTSLLLSAEESNIGSQTSQVMFQGNYREFR